MDPIKATYLVRKIHSAAVIGNAAYIMKMFPQFPIIYNSWAQQNHLRKYCNNFCLTQMLAGELEAIQDYLSMNHLEALWPLFRPVWPPKWFNYLDQLGH
jgi:hypothetical protein